MRQRFSIQKLPSATSAPGTDVYFRVSADPASAEIPVYDDAGTLLAQPITIASAQELLAVRLDPGEVWVHVAGATPWLEVPGPSLVTQAAAEAGTSTEVWSWSVLRLWQAIRSAFKKILAQGWEVVDLGTAGATLTLDCSAYSEFVATLPPSGTTTTITLTNMPTVPSAWPVLHLITGATLDDPIWTGPVTVDATALGQLAASTTYNIGFQPVKQTSGWKIVVKKMHNEADA